MILENVVFRVCPFLFRAQLACSRRKLSTCVLQARRDDVAWPFPVKRSKASAPALAPCLRPVGNAAMDENGRAMDIVFSSIMGINHH